VFTLEERDRVLGRLVELAEQDRRLVAGAYVGSTAEGGDRFSDVDLTFGVSPAADLQDVLADWTSKVRGEFDGAHLFDLSYQSTQYRVFLLPGCLQVDLSFTPGAEFGALGPRFRLIFGTAAEREWPEQPSPQHLLGLAVHHVVRARLGIERGRLWQAEYWLSSARDQVLALACMRLGKSTNHGRGYDDLPHEVLDPLSETFVGSLGRPEMERALGVMVSEVLKLVDDSVGPEPGLKERLRELGRAGDEGGGRAGSRDSSGPAVA
jgi:hypothetical protein